MMSAGQRSDGVTLVCLRPRCYERKAVENIMSEDRKAKSR